MAWDDELDDDSFFADVDIDALVERQKYTAEVRLADGRRISVTIGQHEVVTQQLRQIPEHKQDKYNSWTFPVAQYKHVMAALQERLPAFGVQVTVKEALPGLVERLVLACVGRPNDEHRYDRYLTQQPHQAARQLGAPHVPTVPLPGAGAAGGGGGAAGESLHDCMMAFQRDGVRHALRIGGRVLIGDEMGLGKTLQAICVMRCYQEEWPALVVAPKSLLITWADALHKWLGLTDASIAVIHGPKEVEAKLPSPAAIKAASTPTRVVIASYNTLSSKAAEFQAAGFKVVVLDEAHYIKTAQAERTKAIMPLAKDARRAVLLTGTPALSKPMELVTLLQTLLPKAGLKAADFAERYSRQDPRFRKYYGSKNEEELNRLLCSTVMVRRLKKDVLRHLPPKRRQQIFVTLSAKATADLKRMQTTLNGIREVIKELSARGVDPSGHSGSMMEAQKTIMDLWHRTASLKAEAVAEYAAELLEGGLDKFLLFAHHKEMLDAVQERLKRDRVNFIRIDGSTKGEERQPLVDRFQEDDDVKVALLSIKAAGVGLTMTRASTVVFAEMSWVPGDIQQAEDRCHRIGQADTSVNIHFLMVRDSIDTIIWDTVENKLDCLGRVLDGGAAGMKVEATRDLRRPPPAAALDLGPAAGLDACGGSAGGSPPSGSEPTGVDAGGRAAAAQQRPAKKQRCSGEGVAAGRMKPLTSYWSKQDAAGAPAAAGACGEGQGGRRGSGSGREEVGLIEDSDVEEDFIVGK